MSISLNQINSSVSNHESRIVALENKANSGLAVRTELLGRLTGGTGTLSDSVQNYTLVIIYGIDNDGGDKEILHCHDAASITLNRTYDLPGAGGDKGNNYMYYVFPAWNQITITVNRFTNGIMRVVGLKIYYIFRYNIYNKILATLKFQSFLKLLHLPTKMEVCF